MTFINPKTDFAFKKIFGSKESKDILISFLNALIYEGQSIIQDLEILDPANSRSILELKDSYLDVKAILNDQSIVIIEMQVLNVIGFEKRVVYNLAKTYTNQLKVGQGYSRLNPVIALSITDFILFKETEEIINYFVFKERKQLFDYHQDLGMIFVELPKLTKSLEQLETLAEKWIYFLKAAPSLEVIPQSLGEVQAIQQALNIADRANLSLEELENLERQEMWLEDRQGEIAQAQIDAREAGKKEGIEEGIEKGKKEGINQGLIQGKREIIIQMLQSRLGQIPVTTLNQIETLPLSKLEDLGQVFFQFNSLEQLNQWLEN